jgi:3-phytase
MRSVFAVVVMAVTLTACASLPKPVIVLSGAETQGGTPREGVTESPAIWTGWMRRGEASPTNISFTVSTSRAGGLLVTDLDGAVTERIAGPRLGDIDTTALPSDNGVTVLVGASGRSGRGMGLFFYKRSFDRDTALHYWGEVRTDQSEPRAFCMRQVSGVLKVVAADRRGDARVYHVTERADGVIESEETQRLRVDGIGHGCAIDPISGLVYFSLARGGFARASISGLGEPVILKDATPRRLPRSLGVSFLNSGVANYLVSLDEDRRAFSVWHVTGNLLQWQGRVEVREQADGRAVRNRGGVDAYGGSFGDFPDGVVVVQDQANDGSPNLKYVGWAEVRSALGF